MSAGRIEGIFVAGEPKGPMRSLDSAEAIAGFGLAGDRYAEHTGSWWKPDRTGQELTLIDAAAIEQLERVHGVAIAPGDARRNLVTRGVDLDALIGARFFIGDVECVGIRDCPPCAHLEALTAGGVHNGLKGIGGVRADIVTGGTVRVGDAVSRSDQ